MKKIEIISKSWRLFVLPLSVIFLVVSLFFLILVPRGRLLGQLYAQIKVNRAKLEKLVTKKGDLGGLDEANLAEKKNFALKAVPFKKDVMEMISNISAIASESQIWINSLDVSPGEISTESSLPKGDFETLDFKIEAIGNIEGLLSFLANIEKSLPLLGLRSFTIGGQVQNARVELLVQSYLAFLPKSLGKIDAPLQETSEDEEKILVMLKSFKTYQQQEAIVSLEPELFSSTSSARTNPFSF